MPQLLQISNFTGELALPKNGWNTNDLNAQIVANQEKYLRKLLGDTLYIDFEANPTHQKWVDFVDGVIYDTDTVNETTGQFYKLQWSGVKVMLKYLIYAEIRLFANDKTFTGGAYEPSGENATTPDRSQRNVLVKEAYNKGVRYYNAAILFLKEFEKLSATPLTVSEVSGTYTIELSEVPKYVEVGDKMNKTNLTVTNITDETITATGDTGQVIEMIEWYPFGMLDTQYLYMSNIF